METTDIVGLLAGFLTTVALIPQAMKIWRSKSADDISLKMFIAFSVGIALWLAYGVLMKELPMILWNSVSLALACSILAMKLKFR